MEVEKAISQISEIHSQISRSEHYRGLRALPVALTGATAIFAGFFQHQIINSFLAPLGIPFSICFVLYWCSIAVISLVIALSGISRNYFLHDDTMDRKKTIVILENFLPCLVVGMIVTLGITSLIPTNIALLPGIWTLVFTLGVFAARPFLPRIVGWVGLFYMICGAQLLVMAQDGRSLSPLGMSFTFGVGQFFGAVVLFWNLERGHDSEHDSRVPHIRNGKRI